MVGMPEGCARMPEGCARMPRRKLSLRSECNEPPSRCLACLTLLPPLPRAHFACLVVPSRRRTRTASNSRQSSTRACVHCHRPRLCACVCSARRRPEFTGPVDPGRQPRGPVGAMADHVLIRTHSAVRRLRVWPPLPRPSPKKAGRPAAAGHLAGCHRPTPSGGRAEDSKSMPTRSPSPLL